MSNPQAKHSPRKVNELEGALLDAAVAKAEWGDLKSREYAPEGGGDYGPARFTLEGIGVFSPSTSWGQSGPIIERERIDVYYLDTGPNGSVRGWRAEHPQRRTLVGAGPTPLIAAMRAYVASKFGKEVELP